MADRGRSTDTTAADMERAVEAMRESVRCIRERDYGGALWQSELATLLLRIAASKVRT